MQSFPVIPIFGTGRGTASCEHGISGVAFWPRLSAFLHLDEMRFNSGIQTPEAWRAGQLTGWALLAGWLIRCHALTANGFNSPLLQIHDNTEIPAPFCIDATTEEGGKTQIRNMNSCFHGCWMRIGKLCQKKTQNLPSVKKPVASFRREPKIYILWGYKYESLYPA